MNLGSAGWVKLTWKDLTRKVTVHYIIVNNARTSKVPSVTFRVMMNSERWAQLGLRMKGIEVPLTCTGDGTGHLQSAERSCNPCLALHCAYNMVIPEELTLSPKLPDCVSAHRAVRYPANHFCRMLKELNWIVYCPFDVVQGRWKEERRGIPYLQPLSCCSSVSPGTQLLSWMAAKSMLWVRDTRKHLKLNQQKTNTQTTKPTMWKCTADVILYLRTFVGNFQNWD